MEKQTAVDWLEEQMPIVFKNLTINKHLFEQAKEMHKQEIMNAYYDGAIGAANGGKGQHESGWVSVQMKEKYYKQTFNK
jgi:hypothetical protein